MIPGADKWAFASGVRLDCPKGLAYLAKARIFGRSVVIYPVSLRYSICIPADRVAAFIQQAAPLIDAYSALRDESDPVWDDLCEQTRLLFEQARTAAINAIHNRANCSPDAARTEWRARADVARARENVRRDRLRLANAEAKSAGLHPSGPRKASRTLGRLPSP